MCFEEKVYLSNREKQQQQQPQLSRVAYTSMASKDMSAASEPKPVSVEAQRILNVFKNCIIQIEIAESLSSTLQRENISHVMDKELVDALQYHLALEERLEALVESGGEQEGEDGRARNKVRSQLEKNFKNSFMVILRLLRKHPDESHRLRCSTTLGEHEAKLSTGLKVFLTVMEQSLLTSPEEELLTRVPSKPTPTLESLDLMEERLDSDIMKLDLLISQKLKMIDNIKSSLQKNKTEFMPPQKHFQPQMSKKEATLKKRIDEAQILLDTLHSKNIGTEREKQKEIEKLENEIENLLKHFDDNMQNKQDALEQIEHEIKKYEEELQKLKVPFDLMKAEYDQILEKRLQEEEELKVLELKTKAAVKIQAWWRGYKVRRAVKKKGKSKKSKK